MPATLKGLEWLLHAGPVMSSSTRGIWCKTFCPEGHDPHNNDKRKAASVGEVDQILLDKVFAVLS